MTAPTTESDRLLRRRFGAWLKQTREDVGLTQLDLAMGLDYGYPATVSQIERGMSALPEHDLMTWAGLLRVDVKEFAAKYLYFNRPFVFEALYGRSPYHAERLPVPEGPVQSASRKSRPTAAGGTGRKVARARA